MVLTLGQEDSLGWEMAIHSSILPPKIPWTGSLVDYKQLGCKGLDMTEAWLTTTMQSHNYLAKNISWLSVPAKSKNDLAELSCSTYLTFPSPVFFTFIHSQCHPEL